MTMIRTVLLLGFALALGACGSFETVARNVSVPMETPRPVPNAERHAIADIRVTVPRSLSVSEANRYYPAADIVWHGDPPGDRHEQIAALFRDGLEKARPLTAEGRPALLDIEVDRFHGITPRARYTTGGVHSISFTLTLRDPETGVPVSEPRRIRADLRALGGARAISAENRGITQKVRIVDHLARVFVTEMTDPEGYRGVNTGLYGLINLL
ncbi:MAG: DUF6778 family protein [Paracoccaceae bacterium]